MRPTPISMAGQLEKRREDPMCWCQLGNWPKETRNDEKEVVCKS